MKKVFSLLLFLTALLLAVVAISLMTPIADDFHKSFYPVTVQLFRGETILYDHPGVEFYNAPWILGLWIPFVAYPYVVAQGANTLFILLFILASVFLLQRDVPKTPILLAILNIPNFVLIVVGETDAIPLLGAVIGYVAMSRKNSFLLGAAFFLMTVKPQNVLLVMALFLFVSREWKPLLLPIAAALASGLLVDFDWPLRLVRHFGSTPPGVGVNVTLWLSGASQVSLWVAAVLALCAFAYLVKRYGFNEWTFSLALATNLVFSPYVLWAHFVLLIPAVMFIGKRDWRLVVIPYLASCLLPLVPQNVSWLGMLYPLIVFVTLWGITVFDRQRMLVRSVT